MRFIWLTFIGLVAAVLIGRAWLTKAPTPARPERAVPAPAALAQPVSLRTPGAAGRADSVVAFGLAQQGTPYVFAGTSPLTGFDCSGFIMYTFAHFGVAVPHSTALLIDTGQPVARAEARPGDIVVFTGTASTSTTPGHAGIVVSRRGELPLRFVHASSSRREPFVKVSHVEGTDYERRFMQVRRVLGPGEVATPRPAASTVATVRGAAPVPALRTRKVAVSATAAPVPALPQKLAPKKLPISSAKKKAVTRARTTRHQAAKAPVRPAASKSATAKTNKAKAALKTATKAKTTKAKTTKPVARRHTAR